MARARRAARSASSTRWGRIISAPSRSPEKLRRIDDIGGPDMPHQFSAWLGDGVQHAAAPLQAKHPWRRHPRSLRHVHGRSGCRRRANCAINSFTPAIWCRRCSNWSASSAPAEIAGCAQMPIEGESFARSIADRCGAVEIVAAIFRDVRASRHLAPRLEGGRLSSAGHAVRERQMGAVSSRPRFLRGRRPRRPRSRNASPK